MNSSGNRNPHLRLKKLNSQAHSLNSPCQLSSHQAPASKVPSAIITSVEKPLAIGALPYPRWYQWLSRKLITLPKIWDPYLPCSSYIHFSEVFWEKKWVIHPSEDAIPSLWQWPVGFPSCRRWGMTNVTWPRLLDMCGLDTRPQYIHCITTQKRAKN